MTGKITMEVVEDNGIAVAVQLKDANNLDRLALVHALGTALKMTDRDWDMFNLARSVGIMQGTIVDMSELYKRSGKHDEG